MSDRDTPDITSPLSCVGRAREIATIREQVDLALTAGAGFCLVSGEAGAGKSTLLRAFVASLQERAEPLVVAWGHCDQQTGTLRPLAPWTEILQSFSGTSVSAVPEEELQDRNRVLQSIRSTLVDFAPDIIELLIPGVSLVVKSARLLKRTALGERLASRYSRPEALEVEADRSRLQEQYVAIIERVLDKTPLVIVMDDLDYSDEASLRLLNRIVDRTRDRKILFLAAMRPERNQSQLESAIGQVAGKLPIVRIDLDDARESRGLEFVKAYLDTVTPGIGEDFAEEVWHHTGGNPLFVAELIKHLSSHGQISRESGSWEVVSRLGWTDVPRIDDILARQVAALDPELLDILQAGSVEGGQFSIEVVAAVLEKSPVAVSRALARRAPRNLLIPLGSRLLGAGQVTLFRFTHSLARQHIYSGIDALERIYLHRAVAQQLETLAGDATRGIAAQLAVQFEQAQLNARAVYYFQQAAELAVSTCSLTEATAHLERALALCTDRTERMQTLHRQAKLKLMVGSAGESVRLASEAADIAGQEDSPQLSLILADQALALVRANDLDSAEAAAGRAEQLARERDDRFGLLSALETLAQICGKRGRREAALAHQEKALELARCLDDKNLLATSLTRWGWCLKEVGRYPEARSALDQSLAIQTAGQANYSQLAGTYNALADLDISTEQYAEARQFMLLAIDCWRKFDRNAEVAVGLSNLANLANREGLFGEALGYGREAYREDLQVLGDDHPELAFSLSCIGESLIGLGEYAGAIESLEKAYGLRRKHGAPASNLAWTGWLLGKARVESGLEADEGWRHIRAAREELARLGAAAASEVNEIDQWLALHRDQ